MGSSYMTTDHDHSTQVEAQHLNDDLVALKRRLAELLEQQDIDPTVAAEANRTADDLERRALALMSKIQRANAATQGIA